MKRIQIIIVLLLLSFFCVTAVLDHKRQFRVIPSLPNEGFSIFSKDAKNGLATSHFINDVGKPYWTPDIVQVRKAEAGLSAFLTSHPPLLRDTRSMELDLGAGCRQYFGATKKGKKIIIINALCGSHAGCGNGISEVLGGGFCYFQVFYDTTTNEYSGLYYNSPK